MAFAVWYVARNSGYGAKKGNAWKTVYRLVRRWHLQLLVRKPER